MQKIIIAGGFGFVGKNLVEFLTDKYECVIIDKTVDHSFIRKNPVRYYQHDFSDTEALKTLLKKEHPDFIINLISIVSAERNLNIFNELLDVNFKIFLSLYEASKDLPNLKLLLNFGSAEEYGPIKTPFRETDREEPSSPYALVKQLTTNTAIMLNRNYGFPVCVVRPGNLFGKYQNHSKIIPYIVDKLKRDENIDLTPGDQKRDFIHIKDFAFGINIILENYSKCIGRIINVASGESHSIKSIVNYMKTKQNSKSVVTYGAIPYRENEMMDFNCDISKLQNLSSTVFKTDVFSGLDLFIREMDE